MLGQMKLLRELSQNSANSSSSLNPKMFSQTRAKLQAMPSILNKWQEEEFDKLGEYKKMNIILQPEKDRLQAFKKLRYHPQLQAQPENRALIYLMKDLEAEHELNHKDEDILFALQKWFNCLPYITEQEISI